MQKLNPDFQFSYSSLKKLLEYPKLFYKEYILEEKEDLITKSTLNGSVLHCLLLEPENFSSRFHIMTTKLPSDNLIKIVTLIEGSCEEAESLKEVPDEIIIAAMNDVGLYEKLSKSKRIDKVLTTECEIYFSLLRSGKTAIDDKIYDTALEKLKALEKDEEVKMLIDRRTNDFLLENLDFEAYPEYKIDLPKYKEYPFGFKGYIDYALIDHKKKTISLYDLKTTSGSLENFPNVVDKYKYSLQAGLYTMTYKEAFQVSNDENLSQYQIEFKFIVIDKYDHVFVYKVSEETLKNWMEEAKQMLHKASFHVSANCYHLPYDFVKSVKHL